MALARYCDEDDDEPDILSRRLHQAFDAALDDKVPDELMRLARQLDRQDGDRPDGGGHDPKSRA